MMGINPWLCRGYAVVLTWLRRGYTVVFVNEPITEQCAKWRKVTAQKLDLCRTIAGLSSDYYEKTNNEWRIKIESKYRVSIE